MIVITGRSNSGKTTILKEGNFEFVELDKVVKNFLYKRRTKLYWEIKDAFGKEYVSYFKVNTKKLAPLVFNDPKKLAKLDKMVMPYIKTYLEVLKQTSKNAIVDMPIYMKNPKAYASYFSKVVLVENKEAQAKALKYNPNYKPMENKLTKVDLKLNGKNIEQSIKKLQSLLG